MADIEGHPLIEDEIEIERMILLKGAEAAAKRAAHLRSTAPNLLTPSRRLVAQFLPAVVATIKAQQLVRPNGHTLAALERIRKSDPEVLAVLALETCMAAIYAQVGLISLAHKLGSEVFDEEMIEAWEKTDQTGLYHYYDRKTKRDGSTAEHRRRVLISQFNDHVRDGLDDWEGWAYNEKVRVGSLLIDVVINSTKRFFITKRVTSPEDFKMGRSGARHDPLVLDADGEMKQWAEAVLKDDLKRHPRWLPMVVPPRPFDQTMRGSGYHTRFVPPRRMIETGTVHPDLRRQYFEDASKHPMPLVLNAINAVGATGWAVNTRVLEVAEWAWAKDNGVGDLPRQERIPDLPRGPDFGKDPAQLLAWKRQMKIIHSKNAKRMSNTRRTRETLNVARMYAERTSIYYPHMLDFRGRLYARPNVLVPQGDDLARGLLTFDTGKPIGEDGMKWLKIHLANCWGRDKESFDRRIRFVEERHDAFIEIAADPFGCRDWADAELPWQALAACFEYADAVREGPTFLSRLPLSLDGSCNGLQHLSAMSLDGVTGPLVNLTPSEMPQDIYAHVARLVTERLLEIATYSSSNGDREMAKFFLRFVDDDGDLPRSFAKKPVMILPYGGRPEGYAKAINEWFLKHHPNALSTTVKIRRTQLSWIAKVTREITMGSVETSVGVMQFLMDCARVVANAGKMVEWITPAGLLVRQLYTERESKQLKIKMGGRTVKPRVESPTLTSWPNKHANTVPPNFTHSMDACALMFSVEEAQARGITHFMAVHDSYGTHAADMNRLTVALREGFLRCYEGRNVLQEFRDTCVRVLAGDRESIYKLPDLPKQGTLDLSQVRQSPYFFA